jgi:hypothetical protein
MTYARRQIVNRELSALDAEIQDLHHDLEASFSQVLESSSSGDHLPPKKATPYKGTASRAHLFTESVAILERRSHKPDNVRSERSPSEILPLRSRHRVHGYKPISDRIDETRRRKERFIEEGQIGQEEKFVQEHPFRPKINAESKHIAYPPGHLFQRRQTERTVRESRPRVLINPKSREIASRLEQEGANFLTRQVRLARRAESVGRSGNSRKITKLEAEKIGERLSQPRVMEYPPPETTPTTPVRKRANPKSFERLLTQSLKRRTPQSEERPQYESKMDGRSRQMTRHVESDLFRESLEIHERQCRRAEEIKQWQELAEVTSYAYQPPAKRDYVPTPKKHTIAGVDEFLERMTRKHQHTPEPPAKPRPAIIVAHPFSFDERPVKTHERFAADVEGVLSEIARLLGN